MTTNAVPLPTMSAKASAPIHGWSSAGSHGTSALDRASSAVLVGAGVVSGGAAAPAAAPTGRAVRLAAGRGDAVVGGVVRTGAAAAVSSGVVALGVLLVASVVLVAGALLVVVEGVGVAVAVVVVGVVVSWAAAVPTLPHSSASTTTAVAARRVTGRSVR